MYSDVHVSLMTKIYFFSEQYAYMYVNEYEIKSGKQRWDGSTWDLQTSVGDE